MPSHTDAERQKRLAERRRVEKFYNDLQIRKDRERAAAAKVAPKRPPPTKEEIRRRNAASNRKAITQKVAPTGWIRLLQALGLRWGI